MIALELRIGGSYPRPGNGVTLSRFLESSFASFDATSQPLDRDPDPFAEQLGERPSGSAPEGIGDYDRRERT
jgi:hypothetical protein